jgi:creatinine amidohydrolase
MSVLRNTLGNQAMRTERSQTSTGFPLMEQLTVLEMRAYLERSRSILLPVGITEQHGYHLPLCTDSLIATGLAKQAGQKLHLLVAPVFTQCYSGGTLPGTINIPPAVMALALGENLASLAAQGFRNFYLVLGHGGSENMRALQDSLQMLLRNNPMFSRALIALLPVWRLSSPGKGWNAAIADRDWHAGWLETSLVMHLAPNLVRMSQLELDAEPLQSSMRAHPDNYQQAEKIVDDPFVLARTSQRPEMRVGVMGDPRRASPELGREINDDAVTNLVAHISRIETGADGCYKKVKFTPAPIVLLSQD